MKANLKANTLHSIPPKELFNSQKRLILLHPSGEYSHGTLANGLVAIKDGERDSLMDERPDRIEANYGAIQDDDLDVGLEFGLEDIRGYLEDWDGPNFFLQVSYCSYPLDLTTLPQTPHLLLHLPDI